MALPQSIDTKQSLLDIYEFQLKQLGHSADAAQRHAVEQLDDLRRRLLADKPRNWWQRLWRQHHLYNFERGLYLWGGVGRGKTWLMDLFYESLPIRDKQRSHFHRFMQFVHHELHRKRNRPDPLNVIALQLAAKVRVLCFDEFYVSDIADAMLLSRLLQALFDQGVTLVATSNCAPDDLYKDGLQRARFMPAIKAIKDYTLVLNVDSGIDYRLRHLEHAQTWFDSSTESTQRMQQLFTQLAQNQLINQPVLLLNHRKIRVRQLAHGVAWFDFNEICDGPRGQADYIELARCYHSVFISGVPQLDSSLENQARRFISLVDEFYDRGVKLFVSAVVQPQDLYKGGLLNFEFQRTLSRLIEMQSKEYLSLPHRP